MMIMMVIMMMMMIGRYGSLDSVGDVFRDGSSVQKTRC